LPKSTVFFRPTRSFHRGRICRLSPLPEKMLRLHLSCSWSYARFPHPARLEKNFHSFFLARRILFVLPLVDCIRRQCFFFFYETTAYCCRFGGRGGASLDTSPERVLLPFGARAETALFKGLFLISGLTQNAIMRLLPSALERQSPLFL